MLSGIMRLEKKLVLAILVLALSIRLFFVFTTSKPISGDQYTYDVMAQFLLKHHSLMILEGKPTAYVTPLYPIFMAGVYACFGHSYLWLRIIQALMGAFLCFMIYLIAKEAFDKRIALLALLLTAIHHFFISFGLLFYSENLFMVFLAVSILFLIKFYKSGSYTHAALFGLFSSLAVLTRSAHFLFIFFAAGALLLFPKSPGISYRKLLRSLGLAMLCFVILLSFWIARNYLVFKAFIPLGTEAGPVMYAAYHPYKGKILDKCVQDPVTTGYTPASEYDACRYLLKETRKSIQKDPSKLYKYIPLKVMYFFSVFDWLAFIKDGVEIQGAYNFSSAFIIPLFLLGAVVILFKRRGFTDLILLAPMAYYVLISALVMGIPRTRLPVEPYMIIFAAFFMVYLYDKMRSKFLCAGIFTSWYLLNYLISLNSGAAKNAARSFAALIGLW